MQRPYRAVSLCRRFRLQVKRMRFTIRPYVFCALPSPFPCHPREANSFPDEAAGALRTALTSEITG
jgi:hypothetical protein